MLCIDPSDSRRSEDPSWNLCDVMDDIFTVARLAVGKTEEGKGAGRSLSYRKVFFQR